MVEIRKIITTRETIFSELGVTAPRPVVRAVGMAVILNPFVGRFVDDLRPLFEAGAELGERLMPELVKLPPRCFGWVGERVGRFASVPRSASPGRWARGAPLEKKGPAPVGHRTSSPCAVIAVPGCTARAPYTGTPGTSSCVKYPRGSGAAPPIADDARRSAREEVLQCVTPTCFEWRWGSSRHGW